MKSPFLHYPFGKLIFVILKKKNYFLLFFNAKKLFHTFIIFNGSQTKILITVAQKKSLKREKRNCFEQLFSKNYPHSFRHSQKK